MYISKIMVGQTVKTGDNYNKMGVEGTLSPSDDYTKCKAELQAMVDAHFDKSPKTSTPTQADAPVEEKPKRTRRAPKKEAETQVEEPVEEKKKPARRRKAAGKKKNVNTPYDRTNKEHKKEISAMLDQEFEGWSEDDGIKKGIKAASTELNGTDFLGDDGVMLPDFVEKFCTLIEDNAE